MRVPRGDFAEALRQARRATGSSSIPVLSYLRLTAAGGKLTVSATNGLMGMWCDVVSAVDGELDVIVHPRIADLVAAMRDGVLAVRLDGTELVVSGKGSEHRLPTMRESEWPIMPARAGEAEALDVNVFAEALGCVLPAASRDHTRPVLTGVQIEPSDDGLVLSATDSYRAVWCRSAGRMAAPVVIPSEALRIVARMAPGGLALQVSDHVASFVSGGCELAVRLIDGRFPDIRQLAPDTASAMVTIEVDSEELIGAIKRLVTSDVAPARLSVSYGTLTVSCVGLQSGSGREDIAAKISGGTEQSIGANGLYLSETVAAMGTPTVRLIVVGPLRPIVVEPVEATTERRGLVMPVSLGE